MKKQKNSVLKMIIVFIAVLILKYTAAFGGEYHAPLVNEPHTLDPAYITGIYAVNVALSIFDGLVEFDNQLNMVPAIARRWIISRDHRTYTFFLRKGVKFHNGREVTADDFIYSFTRILNPANKSPFAFMFSYIKGAKNYCSGRADSIEGLSSPNIYTLKIEMEEPFAPFLSILATANAKVVPKEAVNPDFGKNPVGTGAFQFESWTPGKSIVLKANKKYFAGSPLSKAIFFRIYKNDQWDEVFKDFELGLLDQAIVPKEKYEHIAKNSLYTGHYRFNSIPGINLVYIGMNQKFPIFKDKRVRQAFSYAVDAQAISRQITGRGSIPAKSVLPPGIAGFNPALKGYNYDPDKALELLESAGYPKGRGIPPIEIWTASKRETVKLELAAYQKYLKQIGIEVIPKTAENWKEFINLINKKKAPLFYAAWYADYPDPDNFLYVLFHSKSPTNRMGYSAPEVDKMLEQARHQTDYVKRVKLYQKVEQRVMDDAVIICQHINSSDYLLQPWVEGVEMNYLGPAYVPMRKIKINREKRQRILSKKANESK